MSAVMATPLAWPRKAVASEPTAGLAATSSAPASTQSSLARMASISMRPMRPDAPATATRQGVVTVAAGVGVPVMKILFGWWQHRDHALGCRGRWRQRAGASSGG